MQKRGKTAQGKQRWLCVNCRQSRSLGHETQRQGRLLDRFVAWLLGKQSQTELSSGLTDRTWRNQTSWCWQIIPKPQLTGEIYPIILLDAMKVGSLVCLMARTPQAVTTWTWVGWESSHTWEDLLQKLPAPTVVVCDGQKGVLLAIARCWPKVRIQRCIFHVWQNVRTKLSLHPQTEAGRELLGLSKVLLKGITTKPGAQEWQDQLKFWEKRHGNLIRQRTYADNPQPGQHKWWYTHGRLRSAYKQLEKLLKDDQLFTYLETHLTPEPIPRTTNYVEGGINSQLRTKLKLHRGMSEDHQYRLVEWYLYGRTEDPKPPRNFL